MSKLSVSDESCARVLSIAAHEIRGPLSNIIGFSELLIERPHSKSRTKEIVKILNRQAQNLNIILERVLDIESLGKSGNDSSYFETSSMEKTLFDCIQSIAVSDCNGAIVQIPNKVWPIICYDKIKVTQAFTNILNNACKYSENGSVIKVSIHLKKGQEGGESWFGVEVSDRGVGIAKKDLKKVGTMFYRAPNVTEIPGTGLGLALTKEIMKIHNGELTIDSIHGVGTSVVLWFPIVNN